MRYAFQGWNEVSLVTVFSEEFSVGCRAWQPIEGVAEVESARKSIYSDGRQLRLVGEGCLRSLWVILCGVRAAWSGESRGEEGNVDGALEESLNHLWAVRHAPTVG